MGEQHDLGVKYRFADTDGEWGPWFDSPKDTWVTTWMSEVMRYDPTIASVVITYRDGSMAEQERRKDDT